MTKKSRQKFKYLEYEESFLGETKIIFHHFKGLSLKQIKYFSWKVSSELNLPQKAPSVFVTKSADKIIISSCFNSKFKLILTSAYLRNKLLVNYS